MCYRSAPLKTINMQRRQILSQLRNRLNDTDIVIAALAGTTTDCYAGMDRPLNLYSVGMGMVSQVAFGLASALPRRRIIALDTDGGMLLAPSILSVIGRYKPANLSILIFDNERLYGSRGGPPSQTAYGTDLAVLAAGSGIQRVGTLKEDGFIEGELSRLLSGQGPSVVVAKVEAESMRLEGPPMNGQENKFQVVRMIEGADKIRILSSAK